MSTTVTVEATWRIPRVEFNTPFNGVSTVVGYSEALLKSADGKTDLGTMQGDTIHRDFVTVIDDTVEIDGATINFKTVAEAVMKFIEKWRLEDAVLPEPAAPPPGAPLTAVPAPSAPPKYDELPPPIEP
jgi:hypothetical protein